jgi:ASC-1-like (ASCH) protein
MITVEDLQDKARKIFPHGISDERLDMIEQTYKQIEIQLNGKDVDRRFREKVIYRSLQLMETLVIDDRIEYGYTGMYFAEAFDELFPEAMNEYVAPEYLMCPVSYFFEHKDRAKNSEARFNLKLFALIEKTYNAIVNFVD